MRTKIIPKGARHLRTYAELKSYLTDFVANRYGFLWIVGRPGVAKTESLRAALRGQHAYLVKGGLITPLQFYRDCHTHRGEPIILDDAEHLLDNKVGAKLVAALGDTTPAKFMSYASTTRGLGNVPQSYSTTSPLCIVSNRSTTHEDIQSRAVTLYFDPTSREVHAEVATWFWDQEIHDWFGQHLYRLPPLEARWYVLASQDKRASRDWRQLILRTQTPARACCIVQDLESDPAYPTTDAKVARFRELVGSARGASRPTYFRLRRALEQQGRLLPVTVSPMPLRRTRPPGTPSLLELDELAALPQEQPEEEPRPLDLPAREQFAQPIRGQAAPQQIILDDLLPGERPVDQDDESDE